MEALELIQLSTNLSCGISFLAFTFVASASRSEKIEALVQWTIVTTCLLSAILLMILKINDSQFWGSNMTAPPMAAFCIIIAISARINLKGKQISRGVSPHKIRKLNNNSEK